MTAHRFRLEEKLLIIDVKTISFLLNHPNGIDVLSLYFFYYKTAKQQNTNQVRATEQFCRKGLHLGVKKFRAAQAILKQYGLVEVIKNGHKWYIHINYLQSNSAKNSLVENEPNSAKKELVTSGTQMLNKDIIKQNAFTITNVIDDATPKTGASCPLKGSLSPLKTKYPKGHIECVEYVTSFKFVNKGKQFRFLHQMLRAGLDFPDIDKLITRLEKKPYYQDNGYDFATIASEADRSLNRTN